MATRTAKRATSRTPTKADPLERALRGGPRCECEHDDGQCHRRATFRVSVLCADDACDKAVHVHLLCLVCKNSWVHQASHDPGAPELRVTPL